MKIGRTARFAKAWKQLNPQEKVVARKAIVNMATGLRYPALNVKKMKGIEGIWEASASLSLRITFQITGNTIILRNVGRHDETLERP